MEKTATTDGAATASEDIAEEEEADAVAAGGGGRHAFAHLTKNGKITMVSDAISSN